MVKRYGEKATRLRISADGKTWTELQHANCRCVIVYQRQWVNILNPGLLSMRWPNWVARHYQWCRQIEGKRAGRLALKNSAPITDEQRQRAYYGGNN